ncbi:hypothetical protein [Streptomyces werraensis]|uniref:hypothetical protein n=1 Tax=Streptomyces werraensis TaxID=68284 RepID=UPI0037D00C7B
MFEPGDPARTGRVAFWDPAGGTPPASPGGEPGEADLVVPDEDGFTVRTVPVLRLTPARALPVLLHARRTTTSAPATTDPASTLSETLADLTGPADDDELRWHGTAVAGVGRSHRPTTFQGRG